MVRESDETKKNAKAFFKKHKSVKCPAFPKEKVYFNSRSLNHLFYEGAMSARPSKETETRVSLLPRAFLVLKRSSFWQEERIVDHKGEIMHYWSLEAVVEERRIKVIVRQKGGGRKFFWSVIPSWRKIDGRVVNARSDLSKQ
ncbi:MAG: hypothetical protein NT141_01290 [candidate division WWE3 bacterium]|nr:hypothetical protein [candidate division WWE3 bacterium]